MLQKRSLVVLCAIVMTLVFGVVAQAQEVTVNTDAGYPAIPLDSPMAAFIMTNDFAISKGASAEWRKLEWTAVDEKNMKIYFAVSRIGAGMSDEEGDIQLVKNDCGAIYVGNLDETMNVTELKPLIVGGPWTDNEDTSLQCDINNIAEPDNLFVDANGNLWIGEDTDRHPTQFLWMWNGSELKRFASVPNGAEVTGVFVSETGTVFFNAQHPDVMNPYPYNQGVVGIVTGFNANTDSFESIPAPEGDATLVVNTAAGAYQVLGRGTDVLPNNGANQVLGQLSTVDGDVLYVCNDPDANMFLPTREDGSEGYLYTNFECIPGGVSKLYIKRNAEGMWDILQGNMVDFTDVNGTITNCGGSVTPWNTALTSEEYPADTQEDWEEGFLPFYDMIAANIGKTPNPFDYGFAVEIIPGSYGTDEIVKHYAMGRRSLENALVMPDNKTVYFGDDGTDRIMYKFVADAEGDLSAGTLFAAKVVQSGDKAGEYALGLEWIELGHATNDEVEAAIRALDTAVVGLNG